MIFPNHRQMLDTLRRGRAAELGVNELLADTLASLQPRCDWRSEHLTHENGVPGCDPSQPGEFVVRVRAHCGPPTPSIVVVCQAQQFRMRQTLTATVACDCGVRITWAQILDFLGPIDEYYP